MATAVKVYQNVQFNGGADLEYPRVHNVAGTSNLPSNAKIGTMAWNTSDNCMYVCYATSPAVAWKKFGAGGAVVEEDGTGAGVKVTAGTASTDGTVTYKIKAYDIKDAHIASNADITWSKLKAGTASSVMVTNASGVPTTTAILPVVNGGTGASTFTADRLLVGAGTGAVTVLGQATSGYILYGNSSNKPVWTSRTDAGLALATGVASSTGSAVGWYRIAQSNDGIGRCFGLFRLHTATSGVHNVILFTAGVSYGVTASVNITQLSNTSYSPFGVTKLRIVYTPTYSNNRAYLELYDVTTAALAVQVRMIEGLGWRLVAPSTAGGIPTSPTNYTAKELTLTRQALQTSDAIKGVDLTASGTVTFSGLTTAGIVHNSASGVLSTSLVSLSADVTGTLPVAHGGIGASSLTANRLLVGNGTSAVTVLAQGTNDYVLVGRGSSVPAWVEKAPKATLADTASKVANKLTILRWKGDVEDWDTDIEYDGSSAHTIQIQTVYGNGILRGQGNGIVKYVYSSTPGQLLARVNTNEQYDFVNFPVYFATCGTEAATTTKVATCSGVRKLTSVVKGTIVYVTFTATNTGAVGSLRLKIDDTADYPLKQFINTGVGNLTSASQILANQTVRFYFDGANWVGLFNYNSTYRLTTDAELQNSASIVATLISGQRFATALEASLLTLPSSDTAGRLLLSGVGTNKASWLGVGTTDYVLVQTANGPAWAEKAPKAVSADAVPWTGITGVPTQFTPTSHSHTYISVVDKRNEFPYNKIITTSRGVFASFMTNSKLGITSDGTYADAIVVSGYGDSYGGSDNALIFCKQSSSVYHTQFAFHSTDSWGTPIKFLDASNYTDYTVTKTGGGATGNGWTISITGSASSATDATNASKVNISASTSKLYVTGVLTSASGNSVIYKDTSVSVTGGTVTATTFSGSLSGGTISGTNLTASGTVKLTGLGTTAGVVHNASDGTLSSSLVSLSADVTGTLPVSKGGTGASSTTAYRVIAANSSANAYTVLGVATTNYVLVGNGGSALPTWQEKAPLASRANYADILRDPDYHTSSSRRTSANNTFADGGLHYYLASTSMTTGKPAEDGSILHCAWDNGNWDTQLFVGKNLLQYRAQNNVANWTGRNWVTVLDANNYTDYVKNGTLSLQANGTNVTTFTANQAGASTFNIGTGSSNGTISVGGTDVAVKGLGSNAYTSTAYLPLAGGTMTGVLTAQSGITSDTHSAGALNMNNSNIYGINSLIFEDLCDTAGEGIQWYRDATHVDSLWVKNGVMYFTPNRTLGGTATNNTVLHTGNYQSYAIYKNRVYNNTTNTTWLGTIPLWVLSLKNGYPTYTDTEFASGLNSVAIYNNTSGSTGVVIERVDASAESALGNYGSGNASGKVLRITLKGGSSPNYGGFVQSMTSAANKQLVQIFRALLPVGYKFVVASNPMGTGYKDEYLTNPEGTGKWEWYARTSYCGAGTTYSSGGHNSVTRISESYPAPTTSAPIVFYLAECNAYDITRGSYAGLRVRYADSSTGVTVTNDNNSTLYFTGVKSTDGTELFNTSGITAKGTALSAGSVKVTGLLESDTGIKINSSNQDRYISFVHASTYSWRIGYEGTGGDNANYLVFESSSNASTWGKALRIGCVNRESTFYGVVQPDQTNTRDLGTSSLKWANVYATKFNGEATNVTTTADTANALYVVGVTSGATTALKRDTSVTVTGGTLSATTLVGTTVKVGGSSGAILKYADSALQVRNSADSDWGAVKVGNLTVEGTITYINTQDLNVADNIITLNSDVTGTPTENGGIEIKRGTQTNASLIWDESNDCWKAGLVGSEKTLAFADLSNVSGTLTVAHGGTGVTSLTANRLLVGNGTSAIGVVGVGTTDYVLVGAGNTVPVWKAKAPKASEADSAGQVSIGSSTGKLYVLGVTTVAATAGDKTVYGDASVYVQGGTVGATTFSGNLSGGTISGTTLTASSTVTFSGLGTVAGIVHNNASGVLSSSLVNLASEVIGTLPIGNLPMGTGATQVAWGNHTHSDYINKDGSVSFTAPWGTWGSNYRGIYRDLVRYGNSASSVTGTLLIKTGANTSSMQIVRIMLYNYVTNKSGEILVSGYSSTSSNKWTNATVYKSTDNIPAVRLLKGTVGDVDGFYIGIGNTDTSWAYLYVVVSEVVASYYVSSAFRTGWTIQLVTEEPTWTSTVTPTPNAGLNADTVDGAHVGVASGNIAVLGSGGVFAVGRIPVLGVAKGGVGLTSYTAGDMLYATDASTIGTLGIGTSGYVLVSSGSAPTWKAISNVISAANPTRTVGLTTVNGSATTFMRSDAVPALSQAIAPTWTGLHTFSGGVYINNIAGSWVSGMTQTKLITFTTTAASSYYPYLRGLTKDNHVWNWGGHENTIGVYGYYAGRTENSYDWRTYWEVDTGKLVHTKAMYVSGNTTLNGTLGVSGATALAALTASGTVKFTGITTSGVLTISSGTVGAVAVLPLANGGTGATTLAAAGIATTGHTHNYAGSTSAGGSATKVTTTSDTSSTLYVTGVKTGDLTTLRFDTSVTVAGGTLKSATGIHSKIFLETVTGSWAHGLSFWQTSTSGRNDWQMYIGLAGTGGCGVAGMVTAPTGTYVTKYAIRSLVSETADSGWTWESCPNGTTTAVTPTIRAELSNTGIFKAAGFVGAGTSITNLNASNLASGTVPIGRIPTGTGSTQVALGNHTHAAGTITGVYHDKVAIHAGSYSSGNLCLIDRNLVDFSRANKMAFIPGSSVTVEFSSDGGTTWVDAGYTEAQRAALFTSNIGGSVRTCGTTTAADVTANHQTKIDITMPSTRYCQMEQFFVWFSGANSQYTTLLDVYVSTYGAQTTFTKIIDGQPVTGDSGPNMYWFSRRSFWGTNNAGHVYTLRFIFRVGEMKVETPTRAGVVYDIRGYGAFCWSYANSMMKLDHMYSWDASQNVTFPAQLKAPTLSITGAGTVAGAMTLSSTLSVAGASTLTGAVTMKGNAEVQGVLKLKASQYTDSASTGSLNLQNSDIYGVNSIKFADMCDGPAEALQWYRDDTHVDSVWVKNGVMYITPNRAWGGTGTNYVFLTSGNYTDYVKDGTLHLQASGTDVKTFTANQTGASTFNIATGSTNGTISVGGTDVAVKGLGSNAYTSTSYLPLGGGTVTGASTFSGGLTASALTISGLGSGVVRSSGGSIGTGAINLASSDVTGTLAVENGGIGTTTVTGVLVGAGTGAVSGVSTSTANHVLIKTSSGYGFATVPSHTHSYAGSSSAGGSATTVVSSASTSNTDYYITGVTAANGAQYYSTSVKFNASTKKITATGFVGGLEGTATNATNASVTGIVTTGTGSSTVYYLTGVQTFGTAGTAANRPIKSTNLVTWTGAGALSAVSLTLSGLGSGVVRASSGALSVGSVNLASEVSGILPVANGGIGISSISAYAIPYASAANTFGTISIGSTAGYVLAINSSKNGYEWVSRLSSVSTTANYSWSGTHTFTSSKIKIGTTGTGIVTASSGALSILTIASTDAGKVLKVNSSGNGFEWGTASSGVSSLSDLTDTTISSPASYQLLYYKNSTDKWTQLTAPSTNNTYLKYTTSGGLAWATITTGSTTLSGLTDTTISNPANNQILYYNGSKWTQLTAPSSANTYLKYDGSSLGWATVSSGTGATMLTQLSDVDIDSSALTMGDLIWYDGTSFARVAKATTNNTFLRASVSSGQVTSLAWSNSIAYSTYTTQVQMKGLADNDATEYYPALVPSVPSGTGSAYKAQSSSRNVSITGSGLLKVGGLGTYPGVVYNNNTGTLQHVQLSGHANQYLKVNSDGDGLEWGTPSGGGGSLLVKSFNFISTANNDSIVQWVVDSGDTYVNDASVSINIGAGSTTYTTTFYLCLPNKSGLTGGERIFVTVHFNSNANTTHPHTLWFRNYNSLNADIIGDTGVQHTSGASGLGNMMFMCMYNSTIQKWIIKNITNSWYDNVPVEPTS